MPIINVFIYAPNSISAGTPPQIMLGSLQRSPDP